MKGASDKRGRSRRAGLTLDQIRGLRAREARGQTGLFFAEGIRFLAEAVHHRHAIQTLVVAPSLLTSAFGRNLVGRLRHACAPCLEISATEFRLLTAAEQPQGVGLVVRQRWERLARVRPGSELCWVSLESVRSPGNLGSIIRTSEAVGAAGVILVGDAIDPFDPVTVRASMGAIFPHVQCSG
jgi:TrmH family RNA methyltransferase